MKAVKKVPTLILSAVLIANWSYAATPQGSDEKFKSGVIEEVVVTAMKRGEQNIIDIPASVSAFSGNELSENGTFNLIDFVQRAPGVSIENAGGGVDYVQIRGISSPLGSATVGYYVDDAPFSFVGVSVTPDTRAFDMERVEVLRGPQGTLYGQGSIAGVIRLLTKNPDLQKPEFIADVSGSSTTDGGKNQQYNAALGIPIIQDKLAIRFTGTYADWDGWIDGLPGQGFDLFGRPITYFSGSDLNTEKHTSYRLKLLAKPSERSSLTALFWDTETRAGNTNASFENRTNSFSIPQPTKTKYKYSYITFSYDFDNYTFLSNTSYTDASYSSTLEFLGTALVSLVKNNGWTQEFRVHSTGKGPWQWTFGAIYQNLNSSLFQDLDQLVNDLFGVADPNQTDDTTNWAVFGDATYYFNEQWDVSVGGRYFHDERITNDASGVFPADDITQKFNDFSPRFNVAWHPNDRSTAYFQVAKGFRSGLNQYPVSYYTGQALGISLPAGAEPEHLWTYELGHKSEFWGGKIFTELAVFYNDWGNLQQSAPVILGQLNAILNAGKAKSPGAEMAIQVAPNDSFSFGGNVSWNDAQYSEAVNIQSVDPATGMLVPVVIFPKGSRIASVPKWTANGWTDFRWPLSVLGGGWEGVFHSDVQYRDKILTSSGGAFQQSDDSLTVRARIGIENERWGIFLYGDNLFDEDGAYAPSFPPAQPTRLRPRTIGINLKFRM